MFGFGRRKKVAAIAERLAAETATLKSLIADVSYAALKAATGRGVTVIAADDLTRRLRFRLAGLDDFIFEIMSHPEVPPATVTVEAFNTYSGVMVTASVGARTIAIGLIQQSVTGHPVGRDARLLVKELARFPDFKEIKAT